MERLYPSIKEIEINTFLRDFEDNSETMLLTEASKQNEIIAIAKNKGIILKDSFDLAGFKCVYAFTDKVNDNKDILPRKELLRVLPSLIGKPVNLSHIRRNVVGMLIDYRYVEKEGKVIAYGIFFKNAFSEEWEKFKKLLKKSSLSTSYEVWNDPKKEEVLEDGSKILHDLQIAGMALLFKEKPAEEDCKVLAIAKKNLENSESRKIVYSCLNKDGLCTIENKKELTLITASEDTPVTQSVSTDLKIVCSNCGENFEHDFVVGSTNQIKCPNCYAILDKLGAMIYPPQIRDFSLSCSSCGSRDNWLILTKNDNEAEVKCLGCASEYGIEFKKTGFSIKHIKELKMLKSISLNCPQCGETIKKTISSAQKKIDLKCSKCGIEFPFDTTFKRMKKIQKVNPIIKKVKKEEDKVEKPHATEIVNEEKSKELELSKRREQAMDRKLIRKAVSKIIEAKKKDKLTTAKLEKFTGGIKKFAGKVRGLRKEVKGYEVKVASLNENLEEVKKNTIANATKSLKRRTELGDFAKSLTDKDLIDEAKYELAKAKKIIAEKEVEEKKTKKKPDLKTASLNVGDKEQEEEWAEGRKTVNKNAFPK